MVRALAAFLDVCYLVRRSALNDLDMQQIENALTRFRQHRQIFQECGVRPTGFSLPRMHAIDHYLRHIRQFAAPNGLCSSITEAKHIKAVKEPWRRSNRAEPLGQMLLTNQRLDKLAASTADFTARGMLSGTCLTAAWQELTGANDSVHDLDPCPRAITDDDINSRETDIDMPDDGNEVLPAEDEGDLYDIDNLGNAGPGGDEGPVLAQNALADVQLARCPGVLSWLIINLCTYIVYCTHSSTLPSRS